MDFKSILVSSNSSPNAIWIFSKLNGIKGSISKMITWFPTLLKIKLSLLNPKKYVDTIYFIHILPSTITNGQH